MKLFLSAALAAACLVAAMYFHDTRSHRVLELMFFGLAAASAFVFEYFLHVR